MTTPAIRTALERTRGYAPGALANTSREQIFVEVIGITQPATSGSTSNLPQAAVGPTPGSLDLSNPASQLGGRKNWPAGPDRDARDEMVRRLVASGTPRAEAERDVFGDSTKGPMIGVFARADEISPELASSSIALVAEIEAAKLGVPFVDGLRIVLKDPVNAPLVDALQPGRNAYTRDDEEPIDPVAAASELHELARAYQRTEKVPYVDALRAVSADRPELAEAREGLYGRRVSA